MADGSGNMNRDLWKACAYRIACEESFSLHERALYAALCGDLRNAMPACQNWEDILWTYYATMLESRSAEALASASHVDRLEQEEHMPDGSPFEGPPILDLSAEEIFQKIEAIPAEFIRDSVRNPFHRMQKMIILDKLDQLVHDVRNELEEDANSADASRAT
jgi:nuclear pore complex protein Nup107